MAITNYFIETYIHCELSALCSIRALFEQYWAIAYLGCSFVSISSQMAIFTKPQKFLIRFEDTRKDENQNTMEIVIRMENKTNAQMVIHISRR